MFDLRILFVIVICLLAVTVALWFFGLLPERVFSR